MADKRFLMNVGRTTKQGQQINVGKDSPEYQAIVGFRHRGATCNLVAVHGGTKPG